MECHSWLQIRTITHFGIVVPAVPADKGGLVPGVQTSEEDEDRDEEEGALAAFGCLRALSTVLESVSSLPHLFPALEPIVFPVLRRMCTQEGQDVYEEIMEILSYFTYFSPEVPPPSPCVCPLQAVSTGQPRHTLRVLPPHC